jgi:glycosyltransferase involved in cell wall biosynthesis
MGIKYIGATRDFSGYGEAARHDIAALLAAGIDVTVKSEHFSLEIADFGDLGAKIQSLENTEIDYDTILLHVTPNIFRNYKESGKYHIGRVFWETDKLPEDFARAIQDVCQEVWTGSEYNAAAIRKAGVKVPIHLIPQAIDTAVDSDQFSPFITAADNTFKFYSIFEWTVRKNPDALLEAFWREFEHSEGVSLTIKTYVDNFTPDKRIEIDAHIENLKIKLGLSRYAPVYLSRNLFDRSQVYRFHQSFDCFVSAHRGEGWGLPQMEALFLGKPVISTNCGGIHEYLADELDACLIPYTLVPVSGNSRNMRWYTLDQNWAQIDNDALRLAMRKVFENQDGASAMGTNAAELMKERFSPAAVGQIMKKRLIDKDTVL